MKPFDSLVPYVLASMHPLLHMSLLFTALLLQSLDYEKFYEITGTCEDEDALNFMTHGKYMLMFWIMTAHLIAILFHYAHQVLNHYEYKSWANAFLVLKVGIYLYAVMKVQVGITFPNCTEVTDRMHVMAWLTYEVVAFYLNIIAVVFFLIVASFKKFKTIRERLGFAGQQRKSMDFLTYVKDDIHWWQLWFVQLTLYICGLAFRTTSSYAIGLSASQTGIIVLLGLACIRQLYFNSKFQFKEYTKVFLGSLFLVCLMMIPRYFYLREQGSVWWAPVVLEIIVAHMVMFVQMGIEYYTWEEKRTKWAQELIFTQQYADNDSSERLIRASIAAVNLNTYTDIDKNVSQEAVTNKELKLAASYYTSTFYALMKKNKKDLKLKESDQADLVYRSYFIFCIQSMFNLVLFMYSGMRFNFIRDAEINVALFFTVLLLHLTCLPSARDGIAMMKYVLVHNDEFSHPITAFALGLISFATMFSAEVVNISAAQNKKSVDIAIAGFIGFKLIIDLPKIYMESMEEFAPKGLVGKLTLKRSRRAADRPKMQADWLFSSIFVCFNVFYKSVFFYFIPFATILYPMVKSLKGNVVDS